MYVHIQAHAQVARQLPSGVELQMRARAGGIWIPTSSAHLPAAHPSSSWEGPRFPPQNTPTHVQQGMHMLISGSPWCKRLGVGGLSTQSPGCCQNPSESCPPQALISGCGGHNSRCGYPPPPPNSLTSGCLLFHNLSQGLELGDHSPCLSPGPPLPLVLSFSCPLLSGGGGGLCLGGILSPGVCPWREWDCGSPGRDKA